jgi:hypothetical protein
MMGDDVCVCVCSELACAPALREGAGTDRRIVGAVPRQRPRIPLSATTPRVTSQTLLRTRTSKTVDREEPSR